MPPANVPASNTSPNKPSPDELETRYSLLALHKKMGGDQPDRIKLLQEEITQLAKSVVDLTPPSNEQIRALEALDDVAFLSTAAIIRNEKK